MVNRSIFNRTIITCIFTISFQISFGYADAPNEVDQGTSKKSRWIEDRNPSAAVFDKRLPPVIPGEEISDGQDRMNVWSTSGGVSSSEPPSAPNVNKANRDTQGEIPSNIGIVVDNRHNKEPTLPSR